MIFPYFSLLLIIALLFPACATKQESVIPPTISRQIDRNISFQQLRESPTSHQGSVIVLGGEVLIARRLKEYTHITLLQLPLADDEQPTFDRSQSEGRFIAMQASFLDPAVIPPGTRVTLVGEISATTTGLLDEMEYDYPNISIRHLKVWQPRMPPPYVYGPYSKYSQWRGVYWGRLGGWYGPYNLPFFSYYPYYPYYRWY